MVSLPDKRLGARNRIRPIKGFGEKIHLEGWASPAAPPFGFLVMCLLENIFFILCLFN